MDDSLKYGEFADGDILSEICKDHSHQKIIFTQMTRPEVVKIWKEFSEMPDRARY